MTMIVGNGLELFTCDSVVQLKQVHSAPLRKKKKGTEPQLNAKTVSVAGSFDCL
jgi:hypothetical protein